MVYIFTPNRPGDIGRHERFAGAAPSIYDPAGISKYTINYGEARKRAQEGDLWIKHFTDTTSCTLTKNNKPPTEHLTAAY